MTATTSPVDHFKVTMTVRVPVWLRREIDEECLRTGQSANALVIAALSAHLGVAAE